MLTAKLYLHSDKESNHDLGKSLKLKGKALDMFLFNCDEVEIEIEVDEKTGESKIVSVDGRKLENKS